MIESPLAASRRLETFAARVAGTKIDYCRVFERGQSLFEYDRHPAAEPKLHKVNSITKSVLSLLVGIAIDRGELPGVNAPLSDYFPEIRELPDKQPLTVEHLLTMTPGWDWQEMGDWGGLPYPMTDSPEWTKFVLTRPLVRVPGTRMIYDSGSSQLLSALVQMATGCKLNEYAERHLFRPLGITDYRWREDPNGIVIGGFGLELPAPSLMNIGLLMLREGQWNGNRIVSADWVRQSVMPRYRTYEHIASYGYHWWVADSAGDERSASASPPYFFAMGYGGQYIFVVPDRELVVVVASSLYKKSFLPKQLFERLIADIDPVDE